MNGLAWITLNLALLLAAVASRPMMKKLSNPELPPITQEEKSTRESSKSTRPEITRPSQSREEIADLDDLWKKSLFCPERTENNLLENEASETAPTPAEKSDFELTGIAWIGRPGAIKPVAVIKQQVAAQRGAVRGRTTTTRGRPAVRTPAPRTPAAEPEKPRNIIFAEGDLINDSGYTLLEINTDENSALLSRGAERLELKIEFGSAASSERKSLAVSEAVNRQRQREQEERAAARQARPTDQAAAAAGSAVGVSGEPPAPPGTAAERRGGSGGRRRPRQTSEGATGTGGAAGGAAIQQRSTSPTSGDTAPVQRTQQQRLQQLYRESAERRARSRQ